MSLWRFAGKKGEKQTFLSRLFVHFSFFFRTSSNLLAAAVRCSISSPGDHDGRTEPMSGRMRNQAGGGEKENQ